MATAANILRELIASSFPVRPEQVILSGEISPEFTPSFQTQTDWANDENIDEVWGFDPQKGFVPICITHQMAKALYGLEPEDNHARDFETPLHKVQGVEKYIMFIVHSSGQRWNGIWDLQEEWSNWTLYKAPDFTKHWAKIRTADLARWADWLNDNKIQNIVNKF